MSRRAKRQEARGRPRSDRAVPIRSASWLRGAIVFVVALKVVGAVLLFDPANAVPFEGPKSVFSLASASVLAALLALMFIQQRPRILTARPIVYALVAVVGTSLLSVAAAQDQYVAVFGGQRRLGLTFIVDMAVLSAAVAVAFRSARDWAVLAIAVGGAGVVAITYGLAQSLGLDPVPWADDVRVRPPSTFGNPDKFGHFLSVTMVAALTVAVIPAASWPRWARFVAASYAAAALGMAAIIATRGIVVGLLAALPALGILYVMLTRGRGLPLPRAGTILAAVTALLLAGTVALASPLGDRVRAGFADAASQQRLLLADAAIRAFVDRPLVGHGLDNFGVIYPQYRAPAASSLVGQDSAHSWPLQALATTGLLGALSIAAVALLTVIGLARAALRRRDVAGPVLIGAIAYWAQGLVAFGSVSIDWVAWIAAGAAASLQVNQQPATRTRQVSGLVQATVIGAGLIVALSGLAALQAGREAQAARVARPPERAVAAARRAIDLDPGRAEYWFAFGLAQRDRRDLPQAARGFREAAERAPYVQAYWSNLAVTLADVVNRGDQTLGGKSAALDAARRGVAADARSPRPHVILAVVANSLGEPAVALDAITMAIRLDKTDPEYDTLAVEAASRLPDAAAARAALEQIVAVKDSAIVRVGLAQLSLRIGDMSVARLHLRRALELDPQNQAALQLARQVGQ